MTGNPPSVITVAAFDTKPYERQALERASGEPWYRVALS